MTLFALDARTQKALDIEYHRQVAAHYDAAVTRYFRFYHVHSLEPWARRLAQAKPDALVLDVGTGTGVVACTVAAMGCRVRAIDHSPDMLDHARVRADSMNVANRVEFDLGDGEGLPYADATFDAVTIQGVLHHLPDVMPMLRQAARVLKLDGQLYISEPCLETTFATQVVRVITAPGRWIKQLIIGKQPEAEVSDHEAPISGPKLVSQVQSLGFKTDVEFLVRVGIVKYLPERMKIWLVMLLSLPTRRSHGDMIFLIGQKTA
jgi:ubiquinone/menaquinone biosynthesis C-methylase UbiE